MRKTTFAGLTVLAPGDSLFADGAAFTTRDRDEIDRGLKLGAKLHRHTGLPGLADPSLAPSAAIIASGGTIEAGLSITVGYTLEDESGGETLISPLAIASTPIPLGVPSVAPIAEADYTSGNLNQGSYTYGITYTDGEGGETPLGPSTLVTRDPGFENAQIKLSGLAAGMEEAGAVGWRLFRARGGEEFMLLAEGDSSEDTFTDDESVEVECDIHPPTDNLNNTNQVSTLQVTLPSGGGIEDATFINLYATTTGSFSESSLLAQYPVASAGAAPTFAALEFLDSQPPDVSTSYGGAHLIDPDTELLDWHWKRPVSGSGLLGSGAIGDVRLATDTGQLYAVLGASALSAEQWTAIGSAAGGDGSPWSASAQIGPLVSDVKKLTLFGSGNVAASIDEPEPGEARINITVPPIPGPKGDTGATGASAMGPPGPPGSAYVTASAASGAAVPGIQKLTILGSGVASSSIQEGADPDEAVVTVTVPPVAGPAGEAGAPGKDAVRMALDAVSQSPEGTGTIEWTHEPNDDPSGVVMLIVQNGTATDQVSNVSYGGVAMTEVPGSPFVHSAGGEDAVLHAFFLGTLVKPGNQTARFTVSGANVKRAVCYSVLSNEPLLTVQPAITYETGEESAVSSWPTSTPVVRTGAEDECLVFGVTQTGFDSLASFSPAGTSEPVTDFTHDFGAQTAAWVHFTSPAGSFAWESASVKTARCALLVLMRPVRDRRIEAAGFAAEFPSSPGLNDTIDLQVGSHYVRYIYTGTEWQPTGSPAVGCQARRTTTQTISSSKDTPVEFNSQIYDDGACFAPTSSKFVVPASQGGKWLFTGKVGWNTSAAIWERQLQIRVNGAHDWRSVRTVEMGATSSLNVYQTVTGVFDLKAGDYVELLVFHGKGELWDLFADAVATFERLR